MNLKPLGDRLIVAVLEEEETTSSGRSVRPIAAPSVGARCSDTVGTGGAECKPKRIQRDTRPAGA